MNRLATALSEIPAIFVVWPAAAWRGILSPPRELLTVEFGALGGLLGTGVRMLAVSL